MDQYGNENQMENEPTQKLAESLAHGILDKETSEVQADKRTMIQSNKAIITNRRAGSHVRDSFDR